MADAVDWSGDLMPSLRDLYGSLSAEEVDTLAIADDWQAIGRDLYAVLNDFERRKALTATPK